MRKSVPLDSHIPNGRRWWSDEDNTFLFTLFSKLCIFREKPIAWMNCLHPTQPTLGIYYQIYTISIILFLLSTCIPQTLCTLLLLKPIINQFHQVTAHFNIPKLPQPLVYTLIPYLLLLVITSFN